MEIKETLLKTSEPTKIIEDVTYFKYIFKKTEKISCAVFYILRSDSELSHTDEVVLDLEDSAREVLNVSLDSLKSTDANVGEKVQNLRFALIELESKLRVAHAARYISTDLINVFVHEIDSVYRSMKKYTDKSIRNPLSEIGIEEQVTERKVARVREQHQVSTRSEGVTVRTETSGPTISRRDRIIEVLRDNPDATIKDIVSVVTDCSEKTIQRELITMIKDNIVVREGERRWSKYKLV